jgi:HK97 family phage portal protein
MSILSKFKDVATKILNLDSVTFMATPSGFEADDSVDSQLQVNYQNSLYVSRAIEVIQDAVSSIDFKLFEITNTKGEYKEIEVSPIIDLLYKPNPLQTKSEFWRILVINYKLSGEAFIQVLQDERSKEPVGLLNLNPNSVEVELTDTGEVKYKYTTVKGELKYLDSTQVIHIKNPNPNSQLRGFSILRPLLGRIEAEIKATEYQSNLFGKNGNPDGVLTVKGASDKDQLTAIKNAFYNSFRGKNESNRVAVVGGDASYTALNSSGNTLDFIASKNNVRDEVFMALGVPKSLITSDDVNRANADAGLQQFMQFTISPMFHMILEVLNERFIIPTYGEQYYLDTEKLVTEDKDQLIKEVQVGVNRWLTVNEVRERFGYEAIEGGDVLNQASAFSFSDPNMGANQNSLKHLFKTRPNLYQKLLYTEKFQAFKLKRAYAKATGNPEFKVKFTNAINSVRDKGERAVYNQSKKFFSEQRARVLAKLEEVGDNITTAGDIFNHAEEKRKTEMYILPLYQNIAVQAGNVALVPTKMLTGKANNFVMNSVLFKKLEHRANLFSEGITDTTFELISKIVADKMNDGVSVIARALKEEFAGMGTVRAERIARTESGYMVSLGSDMAYQESDVVGGKQWLTTGDDKVRDEHVQVDGEIVGKYESFSNGEHFPAEHSINCRCALAPVVTLN